MSESSDFTDAERQALIEDYERARHGYGLSESFTGESSQITPACGDTITVRVTVDDGLLSAVTWQGNGCRVSMASASMLAGLAPGMPVARFEQLAALFLDSVQPGATADDRLGDAAVFAGIGRFPLRARCATLAWRAALAAVSAP